MAFKDVVKLVKDKIFSSKEEVVEIFITEEKTTVENIDDSDDRREMYDRNTDNTYIDFTGDKK